VRTSVGTATGYATITPLPGHGLLPVPSKGPVFGVGNGLAVSDAGSLDIDIAAGFIHNGTVATSLPGTATLTLENSKTYTVQMTSQGVVMASETSSALPDPYLMGEHTNLATVVTSGGAISSITDLRVAPVVHGSAVLNSTVRTLQLNRETEAPVSLTANSNFAHWGRG
jgi:hypothetical protein